MAKLNITKYNPWKDLKPGDPRYAIPGLVRMKLVREGIVYAIMEDDHTPVTYGSGGFAQKLIFQKS